MVSVEPVEAACVQASVAAGHPVSVATGHTIMAGLNCGTVSSLAWPSIHRGLDAAATVTDDEVTSAARDLADERRPRRAVRRGAARPQLRPSRRPGSRARPSS